MIKYIADEVKIENGEAVIPYSQVVFEEQKRINNLEIDIKYVFTDTSSVIIKYTKDKDKIINREKGMVEAKLKRQYWKEDYFYPLSLTMFV